MLIQAGAGGVGMAAIQLAKQAGATVLSTASSDEKLERLKGFGLDHGINYASEDFVARARELTDGRGVDLILDSVGGETLARGIAALAYRGTLVSVGVAGRGGSAVEARELWAQQQHPARRLPRWRDDERVRARPPDDRRTDRAGRRRRDAHRDRPAFPLAEAAAAHAYIESRQAFGRVVMAP